MTALKVIGIILLIFLLIGFLRIGAIASFGNELRVKLLLGHLRLTVYPRQKKANKEKKPKEEKPKEEKTPKEPKQRRAIPKPTLEELIDLIETALSALGATVKRACKRVRIDPLDVTVVLGGDDPALIAAAYGMASAAMFADMPKMEEKFYIPNPSLHLRMDFEAEGPSAAGSIGVSLRICDLFAIAFTLLIPMAKWFLRFKKAHKHDIPAHRGPENDPEAEKKEQNTDDKIA